METGRRKLYFFSNFAFCISITSSLLNIEELHGTKYGLEILSEPVLLKESPDMTNIMLLASKHGQQYQCTLPVMESKQKQQEESKQVSTEDVAKLLQPMEKKCLYHSNGWWTYEVCIGKQISQYHEEGNMVVGDKVSLGFYQSQTDWTKEEVNLQEKPSKTKTKRFHSHFYVNGTECDLTGKPRETLVKFMCEKGNPDAAVRVDEPSSCSYIITVLTARLCENPLFKPPADEKLHPITCSPALPEHHFNIYLETVENKRKATEARKKAREEKQARRKRTDAPESLGETEQPTKKKKTKKSQLWPWDEPAVESEDEMWIDGNIAKDTIGVNRVDITKGRRKDRPDLEGDYGHDTISIMSSKVLRKRQTGRQNKGVEETRDEMQTSQTGSDTETKTGFDESGEGTEQSGTKDITQESGQDNSADTASAEETRQVTGVDPDALDATEKRSQADEPDSEENLKAKEQETLDRHVDGLKKAVDDKLDRLTEYVSEMEKEGKLEKNSNEYKLLTTISRLIGQMDIQNGHLMQKEEALQSLLETQYAEARAQMDRELEIVKNMMKRVEHSEDEKVKDALDTVKLAIKRYEETSRELDADMAAVKKLNKQLLTKVGEMVTSGHTENDPDTPEDFARLASKAKLLLKRLLSRSSELDHEMKSLKQAGIDMLKEGATDAAQAERIGDEAGMEGTENGLKMGKVFDKLKSMIRDIDQTEKRSVKEKKRSDEEDEDEDEDEEEDEDEDEEPDSGDRSGVRVRVTKIKKDGNHIWSEDDGEDLDDETTATSVESRIRKATKKMEEIMKEHLKNSGISTAGKVRVKIVTSREALENFDDGSGTQLLSDEETTQFKNMLMGLLGGSQEAGKERKRQMALEDNYNLVWDKERLGKAAREDDDEDVDELEVFTI